MSQNTTSYTDSQTEGEPIVLPPPPTNGSLAERKLWAFRAYHGVGRDSQRVDEWTQEAIGNVFGVNVRTVRRWLNEDDIAEDVFGGLSERDRWVIYGMAITGGRVEEYFELLRLEKRTENAEVDAHAEPDDSEDDDTVFYPDID
ncbi:hypothetical protein [Saliphagus sp. LR7]|uniref:hypothetical protein n=1 Tax=Saliphagus sp. LR7 TaxID=2282654 RepID=UPI000DF8612E|nr:hypothetical protein [Saliphagus sp. LR7]